VGYRHSYSVRRCVRVIRGVTARCARQAGAIRMGHRVKRIPPQYVKPFVKRSKNDRNDAGAIGCLRWE